MLGKHGLKIKLGKSYNMVNSYAQNRRQPSLELLFEIAKLLNVEVKDLIKEYDFKKIFAYCFFNFSC